MIQLTPNAKPSDPDAVREILNLVVDPPAAQSRLLELRDAANEADKASAQVRGEQAALTQEQQKHAAAVARLHEQVAAFEAQHRDRSALLAERERELATQQKQLQEQEHSINAAAADRDTAANKREQAIAALEEAATKLEESLRQRASDLDRRWQQLQAVIG
jgi:chromosome segregation ATPase